MGQSWHVGPGSVGFFITLYLPFGQSLHLTSAFTLVCPRAHCVHSFVAAVSFPIVPALHSMDGFSHTYSPSLVYSRSTHVWLIATLARPWRTRMRQLAGCVLWAEAGNSWRSASLQTDPTRTTCRIAHPSCPGIYQEGTMCMQRRRSQSSVSRARRHHMVLCGSFARGRALCARLALGLSRFVLELAGNARQA